MAPELAVYLYRDMPARGPRPGILRWKGLRVVVQGPLSQDTGEDIGSQETAHLLGNRLRYGVFATLGKPLQRPIHHS